MDRKSKLHTRMNRSLLYAAMALWIGLLAGPAAAQPPGQGPALGQIEQLRKMMEAQGLSGLPRLGAPGASQELDLAALKEQYQNCVVKIEFTMIANLEETKFNPTKSERYYAGEEPPHGTGFFIGENEILTNAHVVEEARRGSIRIKSPATGNVEFKAEVVGIGWAESIDLAILRLPEDELARFMKRSGLESIPTLEFGDSDKVRQADTLAVFGYPEDSDDLKIIQGKVTGREYLRSGFDRFICGHQFIEVGPAGVVQPGNSGGPALNAAGKVVGIPSRGNWRGTQGWLIPSNIVLRFLDQVRQSEQGSKDLQILKLGLSLTENFPGTAVWTGAGEDMVVFELGVVVRDVIPESLADKWEIQSNDIIVGMANPRRGVSCALGFEGYSVTTGKMKDWPPDGPKSECREAIKLHLNEMIMMSEPGDEIVIWYLRAGQPLRKIKKTIEYKPSLNLPHLGTYDKPDFELWGDFVAQDFSDYTRNLFEVPAAEVLKGGVLVTFVEPNSLASRRGIKLQSRRTFGFAFFGSDDFATKWVIIDAINGEPVKDLAQLRSALRKAEAALEAKTNLPDYVPARKALMKERYVQIGFRTNTSEGRVLRLAPGFPIDEALECREALRGFQSLAN